MAQGGQVGLKRTYLAKLDENKNIQTGEKGLADDGLYMSNAFDRGTASANISNLGAAGTAQYGDNGMVAQSKSKSFPQVAGVWNALPFHVKQKLLGRESDGKGGYVDSLETQYASLIVETETLDRQSSIFYAFSSENSLNRDQISSQITKHHKKLLMH
nr:phage tail protein [Weissella paramesenteroides]